MTKVPTCRCIMKASNEQNPKATLLYVLPPGDDRLAWTRKNLLGVSFSSVSTNPSVASEKTYFIEMANGNRRIPLSSRLSWWIKSYRLRRHNIQRSFWLILPQKKKFTLPLPRQRTNWSKNLRADQDLELTLTDLAFSMSPSGNTTVTYAQLQARLVADVTKLITLQASVNRLPDNRASKPAFHKPTPPGPRREHMRLVEQEEHSYTLPKEGIQYENWFTL